MNMLRAVVIWLAVPMAAALSLPAVAASDNTGAFTVIAGEWSTGGVAKQTFMLLNRQTGESWSLGPSHKWVPIRFAPRAQFIDKNDRSTRWFPPKCPGDKTAKEMTSDELLNCLGTKR